MRIPLAPALAVSTLSLLALLSTAPSSADTVYLTNGKSFVDVVAQVTDSQVRIQMPGGEIRVPKTTVERVEQGDSAYAGFLERRAALGRSSTAKDWLALARWAAANGLDQGARESALHAAQLDPHLEGVATLLRGYGYVYDQDLGRFVSYGDEMHRRGLVSSGGRWISREELQAEQAEMRQAREQSQEHQSALQALEASRAANEAQRDLAESQLSQPAYDGGDVAPNAGYYSPYGVTLGGFSGFSSGFRHGHERGQGFPGSHGHNQSFGIFGSGRNSGGFARVPGSLLPASPPARRH